MLCLALKICELLHKVTQPKYRPGEKSGKRKKGTPSRNGELLLLCSWVQLGCVMEGHLPNDLLRGWPKASLSSRLVNLAWFWCDRAETLI